MHIGRNQKISGKKSNVKSVGAEYNKIRGEKTTTKCKRRNSRHEKGTVLDQIIDSLVFSIPY